MCGIAGIIGHIGETNRVALRRMSDAMVHRGPDAEGTWASTADARGWGALLAHRRLSILDLSPAGAQPMTDPVTGHVLVFNGEIYNQLDIRERLTAAGQSVASTGDTAVMLRALAKQGPGAVRSLRGMFAFALWDPEQRSVLLARDPLGIKPLYIARNPDLGGGWSVAFASELRALLASGLLGTPRLSPDAIASVIWNGFVVGPGTAVRGVELLWPGRMVAFDTRGVEVLTEDFWSIPPRDGDGSMAEAQLAAVLQDDVRLHLASDVPLAVFLSGGVDSSAIANLAQRVTRTPVHTFTLAFEEEELNEGRIAQRVAQAIGTQHHEVRLTEQEFLDRLEAALDSIDQPTFDGVNSYYMSHAIRAAGFTVALAGTGGDELFGGYSSFRDLPILHRWSRTLRGVPRPLLVAGAELVTALLRRSGSAVPPQTRWAKLPEMVRRGDDLQAMYQLAYALFLPAFQAELIGAGVRDALVDGLPRAMCRRLEAETRDRSEMSSIAVLEQRVFLGERLLRDNDVASMAASLEQRVPFVDQVVFDAVDRLPEAGRFQPILRKEALRRIGLGGLDPRMFERPKSGFVLPFDRWIRRGLRTAMTDIMCDAAAVKQAGLSPAAVERLWRAFLEGAPGIYWSRVWAVYVLIRWCQRHQVYA